MVLTTRKRIVRRMMLLLVVAALTIGGSLGLERDSSAKGVLLDQSTLIKKDNTPQNPCDKKDGTNNKNCVPCKNKFDKDGNPKKCKPCTGVDKKGNPKPKNCVISDDGVTATDEVDE